MMNEKAFSFIIYCINSGCDQWPYQNKNIITHIKSVFFPHIFIRFI